MDAIVNGLLAAIQVTAIICVVVIIISLIADFDTAARSLRDWLFRMKDGRGDPRYTPATGWSPVRSRPIADGVLIFADVTANVAFILIVVIVIAARPAR